MSADFELPLRSCTIIITEMLSATEDEPRRIHGHITFTTVAHLGSYLSGSYTLAHYIGYKIKRRPKHVNPRLIGRISLEVHDRHHVYTYEFDDINQFVRFLKEHPAVAEKVEYPPKE